MKNKGLRHWAFVLAFVGIVAAAAAQTAGTINTNFAPTPGADSQVRGMVRQADGRLIAVGQFTTFNGVPRSRVARLNYDGSIDLTFVTGSGADSSVNAVALTPTGDVVVGGQFTGFNGQSRHRLARLGATGSLDAGFAPVVNGAVEAVVVQTDGKVVVGGSFTTVNGVGRNRVARLNVDGSLDTSFNPGAGANNTVVSLALQPDGRLLLAGSFSAVGGVTRYRLARLNTDGTLDAAFVPATLDNGSANFVSLSSDGKVLVGGNLYIGLNSNLLRLNPDGSRDTSFNVGNNVINSIVVNGATQPDGKVLISGYFSAVNGVSRRGIARLNSNGALDATFDPGTGANDTVWSMVFEPEGTIMLGGAFTSYAGVARSRVTRINNVFVNQPPVFTTPIAVNVFEDAVAHLTTLAGIASGPIPENGQSVTNITAISSNPALLPHPVVTYTNGAATATIALTPTPNLSGAVIVTVVAQDNGGTANAGLDRTTNTFAVNILPANDAPTFTIVTNALAALSFGGAQTISNFVTSASVGPADEAAQTLTYLATNDQPGFFLSAPALDANGTLTYSPAPTADGIATVTLRAQDSGGTTNGGVDLSASLTVTLTFTPANQPPAVTFATNLIALAENAGAQTLASFATLSPGPARESTQTVSIVSLTAATTSLFSAQPALAANGTLTFTPATNANGSTLVTLVTADDGGTANGGVDRATNTFTITLSPVNNAPSFVLTSGQGAAVIAWGPNDLGQTNVPANLTDVRAVASGRDFSMALRSNGTVVAWGDSNYGVLAVPADLTNAVEISGGYRHAVARRSDGSIVAWGGGVSAGLVTNIPSSITNVVALSAGGGLFNLALKTDGTVGGWGENGFGQLTIPEGLSNVTAISAGGAFGLALRSDGTVVAWGANGSGQSTVPAGLTSVIGISAGDGHALAVRSDGSVVSWGQLTAVPSVVTNVIRVQAGANESFALRADGTVVQWSELAVRTLPASLVSVTALSAKFFNGLATASGSGGVTVHEDSGPVSLAGFVSSISAGPADESGQVVSFVVTNNNNALFATQPAISTNGTLTFTPATHAFGTATVTVIAQDNGGVDTSGAQTFTITVNAVNDAPSFAISAGSVRFESATFALKWGNRGTNTGQFETIIGIAADAIGNVYVAEFGNHRISKFDGSGQMLAQWGTQGSGDGQFSNPDGVAVDASGNVYVAESHNCRVQKFSSSGQFLTKWGTRGNADGQFDDPRGIAVDAVGNVYVADQRNHRIQKFSNTGVFLAKWGSEGTADGQFSYPLSVVVDGVGQVLVADTYNHRIQRFTSAGSFLGKWGAQGSGDGQFNVPRSIAVDTAGDIYVVESNNHRVQKFDASGAFLTKWGTSGSANGQFSFPNGLTVDAQGSVFVTDTQNYRIQKFVQMVGAGASALTFAEDSGPQTIANLATNILSGPSNESAQTVAFLVTSDNAGLFSAGPTVAANGTLTFTPAANANGTAIVTLRAQDNGGTTNGGLDTSAAQTFTITVTPVDDVPTFSLGSAIVGPGGAGSGLGVSNSPAQVFGWGNNAGRQVAPVTTNPISPVEAVGWGDVIAFGRGYLGVSSALRSDGTVWTAGAGAVGLGHNNPGGIGVPGQVTSLSNIVRLASGNDHRMALKADGSVWVWGVNSSAQLGDGTLVENGTPFAVAGLPAIARISTLHRASLAMTADGSIWAWGDNNGGAVLLSATNTLRLPTLITNIPGAVEISGGHTHILALTSDGRVWAWGTGHPGVTGTPTMVSGLSNITAVAAGKQHSLALRSDGSVWAWGYNDYGQLGLGDQANRSTPTLIAGLSSVLQIAAGDLHSVARTADGRVHTWGGGNSGWDFNGLGQGDLALRLAPTPVPALTNVTVIGVGLEFSQVKVGGTTLEPGVGSALIVGSGSGARTIVGAVTGISPGGADEAGQIVSFIVTNDNGSLFLVQPAISTNGTLTFTPAESVDGTATVTVRGQDSGGTSAPVTFTITITGGNQPPTVTFATNTLVRLEDAGAQSIASFATFSPGPAHESTQTVSVVSVTAATTSLFSTQPALAANGTLTFTPATNANGSTLVTVITADDGGTANGGVDRATNTFTITVTPVNDAPGFGVNAALLGSGAGQQISLTAWGGNTFGQATVPTNLSGVNTIAAGVGHSLALTSNGLVSAWGWNAHDQTAVPAGLTGVTAISAGWYHNLALRGDGTVVAWGGISADAIAVPVGLSGVVGISAGYDHSLALKSDGTVVAWGNNHVGQTNIPSGLTGVVAIAAGSSYSLALRGDGTVVAWGGAGNGQMNVPAGLSGVTAIAAGELACMALKSDGTVATWGSYYYNQGSVPAGLSGVVAISAGYTHNLALKSDGTVVAWGNNANGQTVLPAGLSGVTAVAAGYYHSLALSSTAGAALASNFAVQEDSGPQTVANLVTNILAGPADESAQLVTFTVTNNNNALFFAQPAIGTNGTLTFTPATNAFGTVTVTVLAQDNGGTASGGVDTSAAQTFTITVNAVNDAPTLAAVSDVSAASSASPSLVTVGLSGISVGPGESGLLSVVASSSDPSRVPNPSVSYTSPSTTGTLTFTPVANATGTVVITVTVREDNDANGTVDAQFSRTFNVTFGTAPVFPAEIRLTGTGVANIARPPAQPWVAVPGHAGEFTVEPATGLGPITYQWFRDGQALAGATGTNYSIAAFGHWVQGEYTVVATSPYGTATSSVAALYVPNIVGAHNAPPYFEGTDASENFYVTLPRSATNLTAIAFAKQSDNIFVGLKPDGTVLAFGRTGPNVGGGADAAIATNAPAGLTNVIAVDVGRQHALALRGDGTVVAWGDNSLGQTNVPASATNIVAISAGPDFNLALRGDGTVVAWGGPTGVYSFGENTVPADLSNVVAIAAGNIHSVAVLADGTVRAWGEVNRTSGGSASPYNLPPAGLSNVVAVAAGIDTTIALRRDGTVVGWGEAGGEFFTNRLSDITNAVAVVASGQLYANTKILLADGSVRETPVGSSTLKTPGAGFYVTGIAAGGRDFISLVASSGAPVLTTVPRAQSTFIGGTVQLTALALAPGGASYQWFLNGNAVAGGTSGTLTLNSIQANQAGNYTAVVTNASGSVTSSVATVTVLSPNAAPSVAFVTNNVGVLEDAGAQSVAGFASFSAGAVSESNQVVTVASVTAANTALFSNQPAIAANGTLTFTPAANANGSSLVTVVVQDNGGTAGGGVDRATNTFTITLTPVNNAPTFALGNLNPTATRLVALGDYSSEMASLMPLQRKVTKIVPGHPSRFEKIAAMLMDDGTVSMWAPPSGADGAFVRMIPWAIQGQTKDLVSSRNGFMALTTNGQVHVWGILGGGYPVLSVPESATNIIKIFAGEDTFAALRADNTVVVWGANYSGQTNTPPGLTNVVSVALGQSHTAALKSDGTVVVWGGYFPEHQTNTPAGLSGVVSISAGIAHTVALKQDGTVIAWGNNYSGQTNVPINLSNVVAIHAAFDSCFAVQGDGAVIAWGRDVPGALSIPPSLSGVSSIAINGGSGGLTPVVALKQDGTVVNWGPGATEPPAGLSNVVAVAAGISSSYALRSDGTVVGWGNAAPTPPYLEPENVAAISSGLFYHLALKRDGTVAGWGDNGQGQATPPAGLRNVQAISAGDNHALALTSSGEVVGWGDNSYGAAGPGPTVGHQIVGISAGRDYSLAITAGGGVIAWGDSDLTIVPTNAQSDVIQVSAHWQYWLALKRDGTVVGVGRPGSTFPASLVPEGLTGVKAIATSHDVAMALKQDGSVVTWGGGGNPGLNVPTDLTNAVAIAASSGALLALKSDGTVTSWGRLEVPFHVSSEPAQFLKSLPTGVTAISAYEISGLLFLITNAPADLVTVREGAGGQTISNAITSISAGHSSESGQSVVFHVTNSNPTLFISQPIVSPDGTLTFTPASGQAGTATVTVIAQDNGGTANGGVDTSAPQTFTITVTGINHAPSVAFASNTVVRLEDSGAQSVSNFASFNPGFGPDSTQTVSVASVTAANTALFSNQPAIAANGTLTFTPAANANGSSLVTVVVQDNGGTAGGGVDRATNTFTLTVTAVNDAPGFALDSFGAGKVLSWGSLSTAANPAAAESGVVAVSGGYSFNVILKADGTVHAWGSSPNGETSVPSAAQGAVAITTGRNHALALVNGGVIGWGYNDFGQITVPTAAQSGVVAIGAGANHSLAVKADGTLVGWGRDNYGQSTPPASAINVVAVSAGEHHSLALRADGSVIAWGRDSSGQSTVPGMIGTNAVAVAAGEQFSLALLANGTVVGWGDNGAGQVSIPASATSGVIAIAAGVYHSVALKADGTVLTWGQDSSGQVTIPGAASGGNIAVAAGDYHTVVLNTMGALPGVFVREDAATPSFSGAVKMVVAGPSDESGQVVSFAVTNDNAALFSVAPAIGTNGTLTFTPAANAFGSATVTVVAQDDGGTANGGVDTSAAQTFAITVNAVNDAPGFALAGTNLTVFAGDGAVARSAWATNISAGPANEAGQSVSFVVTNSDNTKFTVQPALAANGSLTFTPAANATGVVTVGVRAVDSGGTANGGVDTSAVQTFTISLAASKVVLPAAFAAGVGDAISVPVSLLGAGIENGVAFTVTYPAALLTYTGASAGGSSAGATVLANTSTAGQAGALVFRALGTTWLAGSNEVVLLHFTVAAGAGGATLPLAFADGVVARQVSDVNAVDIAPVLYVDGAVQAAAPGVLEGDVSPRPAGSGTVTVTDAIQISRFAAGLDSVTNFGAGGEFQRADVAPRTTLGDGRLTVADAIQAQRYAAGLDPATTAGGPTGLGGASLASASAKLSAGARAVRVVGGNLVSGRANSVTLQVDAQGDEAGLSLSLAFDPGALTFVSAVTGQGASGGTVVVNASRASSGRVGLVLMLPAGSSLTAGTRDVVTLTFNASGSGATSISATGDSPVAREVADVNANVLGASFVGGTFNIVLPVGLKAAGMERAADGSLRLVVRNSDGTPITAAQAAKYEVHVTSNLGGVWTVLPNALVVENGALKIVDPAASGAGLRLYRLVETP